MAFLTQRTPVSGIGADALFYAVKSPTTNAEDGPISAAQFIIDLGIVTGDTLGLLAYRNTIATTDLTDNAVTFAKIQSVSTGVLLGRSDAGAGAVQEITLGANLSLSGGVLSATFAGVNLGASPGADSVSITNTGGDNASIPASTPTQAGVMSAADKVRLNSMADSATANSPDATLLDRANHTGAQAASSISDFDAAVQAAVNAYLEAGDNITLVPNAGRLRINATAAPPAQPAAQINNNPGSHAEMSSFLLQSGVGPTPQSGF